MKRIDFCDERDCQNIFYQYINACTIYCMCLLYSFLLITELHSIFFYNSLGFRSDIPKIEGIFWFMDIAQKTFMVEENSEIELINGISIYFRMEWCPLDFLFCHFDVYLFL